MRGQSRHDTRPIASSFPGLECMDCLTTECSFDSQATWVIAVLGLFLTCYVWVFEQPSTGRRPVDWCRNYMSVHVGH